jgi:hypothetical protein
MKEGIFFYTIQTAACFGRGHLGGIAKRYFIKILRPDFGKLPWHVNPINLSHF